VQVHAATVVPAFLLGTWQIFLSRKGAPAHRAIGFVYLALMTITAIAALFVHQVNPDGPFGLSWIHIFVPLTLSGVAGALYGARIRNIAMHRNSMIGTYAGGLIIAGGFALAPGRIMNSVLFG
jgi:uncharacterized membrane protein